MTNENKTQKESNQQILWKLDRLSEMFNDKVRVDTNVAEALMQAKDALKAEMDKNAELQKKLEALENKDVYNKGKNKHFTFLIPQTGSMMGPSFERAKQDVLTFKEHTSSNPTVVFWQCSAKTSMPVSQENISNYNPADYGGSNFSRMLATLPANQKSEHYIYLGNGNLFDIPESLEAGKQLLEKSPKTTFDFVSASPISSDMQKLAEELKKLFPTRVSFHTVNNDASVDTAFVEILKLRTAPAPKKQLDTKPKM